MNFENTRLISYHNNFNHNLHGPETRLRDMLETAFLILLGLFLCSGTLALRTQEKIADKIIRLHVLANSDSPEDQDLKFTVRDAVFNYANEILRDSQNRQDAEIILRKHLHEFENIGEAITAPRGYHVKAELLESEFPTRIYQDFSLPAGRYLSLRVSIGEAAGQNWWCVIFPPLCADNAVFYSSERENYHNLNHSNNIYNFSADEIRLIKQDDPEMIVKFRLVELWESIRQNFS